MVEKCITIAKKSLPHAEAAEQYACSADRGSEEYKAWRKSDKWRKWAEHRAPVVTAQRRIVQMIGDKQATAILFDTIAERFVDRDGGYTRVVRLAIPRLGDAGTRAILELVGKNDRVAKKAQRPSFADDSDSNQDEKKEEPVAAAADSDSEGEDS